LCRFEKAYGGSLSIPHFASGPAEEPYGVHLGQLIWQRASIANLSIQIDHVSFPRVLSLNFVEEVV
jgi:hypothetical protein